LAQERVGREQERPSSPRRKKTRRGSKGRDYLKKGDTTISKESGRKKGEKGRSV